MRYLKLFEAFQSPLEFTHCGFMNSDLLATLILNEDKITLYIFNHGNYSRTRKMFYEIQELKYDTDYQAELIDWVYDYLRDMKCETNHWDINFSDIQEISKAEASTTLLSEYPVAEIGDDALKITLVISEVK